MWKSELQLNNVPEEAVQSLNLQDMMGEERYGRVPYT